MSNGIGVVKYVLLSSYIVVVGAYDFIAYRNIWYRTTSLSSIVWMILATITIILGLWLSLPTFLMLSGIVKVEINLKKIALIIAIGFFIIRLARLVWIWRGGEL